MSSQDEKSPNCKERHLHSLSTIAVKHGTRSSLQACSFYYTSLQNTFKLVNSIIALAVLIQRRTVIPNDTSTSKDNLSPNGTQRLHNSTAAHADATIPRIKGLVCLW
jgi:hypothetical protein